MIVTLRLELDPDTHCRLDSIERINSQILERIHSLMSKVTDFAAKVQANDASLNTKLDAISTGIAALDALIRTLQNTVTGLTPEEQAALDAVVAESDALVTKANAIDTTAPTGVTGDPLEPPTT